jgi:hypothetical protein
MELRIDYSGSRAQGVRSDDVRSLHESVLAEMKQDTYLRV